jgi:hypothetical protein
LCSFRGKTILINETYEKNDSLPIVSDGFCLYSYIFLYGEEQGYRNIPLIDKALDILGKSSYEFHIRAKLLIEEGRFQEGYEVLHTLLFCDNGELPEPMLYFVFCDLEICCKEIDDFKGAYEYSTSKMALLQKMLG